MSEAEPTVRAYERQEGQMYKNGSRAVVRGGHCGAAAVALIDSFSIVKMGDLASPTDR